MELFNFLPEQHRVWYQIVARNFPTKEDYILFDLSLLTGMHRGEETNAHTHAHLLTFTLLEIACRLPGFQCGKDRMTIIGQSIGILNPGKIYVHVICKNEEDSFKIESTRVVTAFLQL